MHQVRVPDFARSETLRPAGAISFFLSLVYIHKIIPFLNFNSIAATILHLLGRKAFSISCLVAALLSFSTCFSFEHRLARIKDIDGYTYVRAGCGNGYTVIDTLRKIDFFEATDTIGNWVPVVAYKWRSNGSLVQGYIHRSRIEVLDTLPLEVQKAVIKKVLFDFYHPATNSISTEFIDGRYDPVLGFLPHYISRSKDTGLLRIFMANSCRTKGSADEAVSFCWGSCFAQATGLMQYLVKRLPTKDDKVFTCESIDGGLDNVFWEDCKSGNKQEYLLLKVRLRELVTQLGLNVSVKNQPDK